MLQPLSLLLDCGILTTAYLSSDKILFLNTNSLLDDSQREMCSLNSNQDRRRKEKKPHSNVIKLSFNFIRRLYIAKKRNCIFISVFVYMMPKEIQVPGWKLSINIYLSFLHIWQQDSHLSNFGLCCLLTFKSWCRPSHGLSFVFGIIKQISSI